MNETLHKPAKVITFHYRFKLEDFAAFSIEENRLGEIELLFRAYLE